MTMDVSMDVSMNISSDSGSGDLFSFSSQLGSQASYRGSNLDFFPESGLEVSSDISPDLGSQTGNRKFTLKLFLESESSASPGFLDESGSQIDYMELDPNIPPEDVWKLVFTYLIGTPTFKAIRLTCKSFHRISLASINMSLHQKTTLNAEEILSLRLPLSQLLIYEGEHFADLRTRYEKRNNLQKLWLDFSLPDLSQYIIFHCDQLQFLDLSHERFSLPSFLGNPHPFSETEVATQDPFEFRESLDLENIKSMHNVFNLSHHSRPQLRCLETLKCCYSTLLSQIDPWNDCSQKFPNLKHLIICDGKLSSEHLNEIVSRFSCLNRFTLENCHLDGKKIDSCTKKLDSRLGSKKLSRFV